MLFVDKEFEEFKEFRTIPEPFDFSIDLGFGEIVDICLELLELPDLLVFSNMRNFNYALKQEAEEVNLPFLLFLCRPLLQERTDGDIQSIAPVRLIRHL